MSDALVQRFSELRLEWARAAFAEELRTDFHRAEAFDSPVSKEALRVLRRQSAQNLQVLANVLPLKVSWETPDAIERRRRLPNEAMKAVETFRADLEREHHEHFCEKLEPLWRANERSVKRSFQASVAIGNRLIMEIGDRWRCGVDGGAPGEWGLIFKRDWGRLTVSMNLSRSMDVRYTIALSDHTFRTIRPWEDYLTTLGIGAGAWVVESQEAFPDKLWRASDFAWWHLNEYEKIIRKIQEEPGPFLTKG